MAAPFTSARTAGWFRKPPRGTKPAWPARNHLHCLEAPPTRRAAAAITITATATATTTTIITTTTTTTTTTITTTTPTTITTTTTISITTTTSTTTTIITTFTTTTITITASTIPIAATINTLNFITTTITITAITTTTSSTTTTNIITIPTATTTTISILLLLLLLPLLLLLRLLLLLLVLLLGRLRSLLPFGLRRHKQSQAWQLHLLSCTCELQSRWASVRRRPPGDRNPSAHSSHVAFKGGPTGNQTKRQQQRKTTAFDLPSRIGDWGYGQHGSWSGCSKYIWTRAERFTDWAHEFYWARSTRASSVVVLPLVCNYETIGSKATNTV